MLEGIPKIRKYAVGETLTEAGIFSKSNEYDTKVIRVGR
jgi:hypothetical protein